MLAGAGEALRDEMGYVLRWPYETEREADLAAARAAIGDDEFDAARSPTATPSTRRPLSPTRSGHEESASGQRPDGTA